MNRGIYSRRTESVNQGVASNGGIEGGISLGYQVLEPYYAPYFSDSSFGFRPQRSAHQALKQAEKYVNAGFEYVADIDLAQFFDRICHDKLMAYLAEDIEDKRVLQIIRRFLKAGIMQNGIGMKREEGASQGSPLSPLLSNIMLDKLDKLLSTLRKYECIQRPRLMDTP